MWGAQRRGQSPWPGTDQRSEKTRIVNIVSTRQRGHERDVLTIRSAHFSQVFWCPHGANTCVAYVCMHTMHRGGTAYSRPPLAAGSVAVTFYEVGVGGCCDLLNARAKVTLRADADEVVHARGARRAVVASGATLKALLADALALRSTVATQANPISSRSHAICCIEWGGGGRTLRLVDLAGSERNYETLQMSSRAFLRESAEINKGLMALKDCFRASAQKRAAAAADGVAAAQAAARATAGGWQRRCRTPRLAQTAARRRRRPRGARRCRHGRSRIPIPLGRAAGCRRPSTAHTRPLRRTPRGRAPAA